MILIRMFRIPDLQRILSLTKPGYERLKAEFFEDVPSTTATETSTVTGAATAATGASSGSNSALPAILGILLVFAISFLMSFGAARLSWCYNMYVGNSTGISIFYGWLAWTFSAFYYPYYAWVLNPVCGFKKPAPLMGGGRKR